jgi:hypothetical protein
MRFAKRRAFRREIETPLNQTSDSRNRMAILSCDSTLMYISTGPLRGLSMLHIVEDHFFQPVSFHFSPLQINIVNQLELVEAGG